MKDPRALVLRFSFAIVFACALSGVGACSLGPKQDDPLTGGTDSGGGGDTSYGPDIGFALDSASADSGKTNDAAGTLDDCDGGDAGDAEGGCVPADGGDADAPTDAPSDAVDDGDAADVVVGG